MPKLVITIDAAGKVALTVESAPGPACHTLTARPRTCAARPHTASARAEYYQQARTAAPRHTQSS